MNKQNHENEESECSDTSQTEDCEVPCDEGKKDIQLAPFRPTRSPYCLVILSSALGVVVTFV